MICRESSAGFRFSRPRPTGDERSTGLGLANVLEIARAHGGTVHAESEGQGKGSRFCLTLPRSSSVQPGPQRA